MSAENGRARSVAAPTIDDERRAVPRPGADADAAPARDEADRDRARHPGGERDYALSLAAHPRAARRVAEAKAWGGLAGFVIGGYLALANHTLADAAFRALLTGIVCYVVVWGAAVFVWRRLVVAELREAEQALGNELVKRASAAEDEALAPGGQL